MTCEKPATLPRCLYEVQTHGQLHPHLGQEFLLTNGMGAYAASSVLGCNTRRYHGLLIAATHPPLGRINTLSRVGEIMYLDGDRSRMLELSLNVFASGIHPRGDRYLHRFELGTAATWHFNVEGVKVTKELLLAWGQNLSVLRYRVCPNPARQVRLELLPFVAMRDFHALRRGTAAFHIDGGAQHIAIQESGSPHTLHLRASGGDFAPQPDWWTSHKYPVETQRGQDDTEDLFNPGRFALESDREFELTLAVALQDAGPVNFDELLSQHPDYTAPATRVVPPRGPRGYQLRASESPQPDAAAAMDSARDHASVLPGGQRPTTPLNNQLASPTLRRLLHSAADFVVRRNRPDGKSGATILAGYPWFADWGRDTMISLPGLLLVSGRFSDAKEVLTLFAQYVSEGMIPNRFDDYTNEPSYNTVDASLWFIHACYQYFDYTNDSETFHRWLRPACGEIIRGYRQGTRYNIKMDPADGLINQGDPSTQLTWMDAKIGTTVFTPRHGKPVEINALWYNALRLMGENMLADQVQASYHKAFWISPFRGLADVVSGSGTYQRDTSIRINQIFAVSLPHSPLSQDQQPAVVETVRRELLTPYGPRTLAPSDHNYHGRYIGNQHHRDAAYHNGTVWPWLIGPFLEAHLRVNEFSDESRAQARQWLEPLLRHMESAGCIGQIPECFDGDAPQNPVGTFAQAWSVAEVLRIAAILEL